MKKVLYFASSLKGLESFVYRELEIIDDSEMEFKIALLKNKGKDDKFYPKASWDSCSVNFSSIVIGVFYGIVYKTGKLLQLIKLAHTFSLYRELVAVLSFLGDNYSDKYDVFYSSFSDRKLFVAYMLRLMLNDSKCRIVTTVHAHEIFASPNEKYFSHIIGDIDTVIAISEKNKEILQRRYGVSSNRIIVNKLTIDTDFFRPKEKPLVLTVCRFEERKGIYEILEVAARMKESAVFSFVGWGDIDVENEIIDRDLEGNCCVYPKLTGLQLKILLQASDIFCLPSKHTNDGGSEGIPVAIMEAMACGKAIVSTRNGSISELVDDVLVEEGSVESLEEGIIEAIERYFELPKYNLMNIEKVNYAHGNDNENKIVDIIFNRRSSN